MVVCNRLVQKTAAVNIHCCIARQRLPSYLHSSDHNSNDRVLPALQTLVQQCVGGGVCQ